MKTTRQLLWFVAAGALGFGVDVGVLYLLAPLLGWYLARVLSFLAAASFTWIFNRKLTFATHSGGSMLAEYLRYVLAMLGGAGVNYAIYVLALQAWPGGSFTPALGVALGSIAGLAVNFLAARYLVFRRRGAPRA